MQLGRRYVTTQAQSQHPGLWDDLRLIICPRIDSQSMDIFRRHSIAGTVPVLEAASGMGTYNGSSIERAWTSDLSHVDDDEFSVVAVAYTDNLGAGRALAAYATNSAQSDDRYLLAVSSGGANRLIWQKRNGLSNVQVDALVDGAMTVGEPFCAVGLSTASALDLWLCSGGTVSRGTASSPPSLDGTVNRGEVGRLYNGGTPIIYWDGGVGLFLEYGRRLTDQEAIQLAADPFCLFEPRRRAPVATFVIPAGGAVSITPAEATHSHAADQPAITQTHAIAAAEAAHAHAADQPAITQTASVAPADAAHTHAADQPVITQTHAIVAAESSHAHATDAASVSVDAVAVTPAEAAHVHTADAPAITQTHIVSPAEAAHAHAADQSAVTSGTAVTPAEAAHAQAADQPAITQTHIIQPADASHGHGADVPGVTQIHVVVAADATHAHLADAVTVAIATPSDADVFYQVRGAPTAFTIRGIPEAFTIRGDR